MLISSMRTVVRRKTCSDCLKPRRLTEFNKHPGAKDGLHAYCRACGSTRWAKYKQQLLEPRLKPPQARFSVLTSKMTGKSQENPPGYQCLCTCIRCGPVEAHDCDTDLCIRPL